MSFWPTAFLATPLTEARRVLVGLLAAFTCGGVSVAAQGFVNLDFELGTTPAGYDPFNTSAAERQILLPGWTTFYLINGVEHDLGTRGAFPLLGRGEDFCLGAACFWVTKRSASHGRYGLALDTGGACDSVYFCGVRQTAVVPADAKSLTFEAGIGGIFGTGSFEITVNSLAVTYFPIGQTNGLTSFAIDVRQLAGKKTRFHSQPKDEEMVAKFR